MDVVNVDKKSREKEKGKNMNERQECFDSEKKIGPAHDVRDLG